MVSVNQIIDYIQERGFHCRYVGTDDINVDGFSSLVNYRSNTLTWIKKQENADAIDDPNRIRLAIVQEGVKTRLSNLIYSDQSKAVFFEVLDRFFDDSEKTVGIGSGTYISPRVKIGKNVIIGHNCTLDGDIVIGEGTRIYNNVNMVNRVIVGRNCVIHSGVNLGHDGFAFTEDDNHRKTMVKHYGGITIGDNVYLGAGTCVERGTIDDTIIEDGVKIDVTCTIGHNTVIRKDSALVAGTILLGSVTIESNAYVASALIKNQSHLEENSIVGMGSVVINDVNKNETVVGVPAKPLKKEKKG